MNNHFFNTILFKELPDTSGIEVLMDLIIQSRPGEWVSDYPNDQDLHELLELEELKSQTIVWLDDICEAKAFCIVDPYNNLLFECVNNSNFPQLFKEAVQFSEYIIKRNYCETLNFPTLDVSCRKDDYQRIECLKNEGFKHGTNESISYKRSLMEIPAQVTLPQGFVIRPLAGEKEINAYVDLHQRTFGTNQMTQAFRHSIMNTPEYDPQLDLVVESPDENLVAFCVCQINDNEIKASEEKSGWTDPIGVLPEFRNMGLAKALMNEGFIRLKARGMNYAKLGTSSDNIAMMRLAETMGFSEISRKQWFSREVN